jgi:hypothetical protein
LFHVFGFLEDFLQQHHSVIYESSFDECILVADNEFVNYWFSPNSQSFCKKN